MKNILLGLAILFISLYGLKVVLSHLHLLRQPRSVSKTHVVQSAKPLKVRRVIFCQDITGSGKLHGVELVMSSVFMPYYTDASHTTELNFGCIGSSPAQQLITITLPAAQFQKPKLPDYERTDFIEKPKLSKSYEHALKKYKADSISFYTDRARRIAVFRHQVDSLMGMYHMVDSLKAHDIMIPLNSRYYKYYCRTQTTDLQTAIDIVDRTFNYSMVDSADNYAIINSDGLDSYGRVIRAMQNKAEVILVNAGATGVTSMDNIITVRFLSPEQAIQFSINNKAHN